MSVAVDRDEWGAWVVHRYDDCRALLSSATLRFCRTEALTAG